MSVAAIRSSDAAAAIRSVSKTAPSTIPCEAARETSSVSTTSNSASLSSCMSLL